MGDGAQVLALVSVIEEAAVACVYIGGAVLLVFVQLRIFKWMQRALTA